MVNHVVLVVLASAGDLGEVCVIAPRRVRNGSA